MNNQNNQGGTTGQNAGGTPQPPQGGFPAPPQTSPAGGTPPPPTPGAQQTGGTPGAYQPTQPPSSNAQQAGGTPLQGGFQPPPAGGYQPSSAGGYQPLPPPPAGAYTLPADGAYPPMGGDPYAGTYGAQPPVPQQPEDNTPANFQISALLPEKLNVPVPKHELNFDEQKFIRLLAGSISLMKDEKIRIIDSIPKLKQSQIDELVRIFEEEKQKFAELPRKHAPQLEKLAKKHYEDWMDIEMHYQKTAKKHEDEDKAAAIRKQLGL